ncbi:MAG: LysR family transcriptional regulator, partial [Myxococcota bacterium]
TMQRTSTPTSSPPVTMPSMPWDDVRVFLALCRARTLGEAARALGVDASTVSRRLAALEQALSCTLFERGRDGVRATKAAEDLLPAAEEVECGVARFATAAEGLEREVSGLVRITCPSDVADIVLVPMLRQLLARHPRLSVALDPNEAILDLTRREADIALRVVRPKRGDLVAKKLFTVRWIPVASRELAERLGPVQSWAEVPWLGCGERYTNSSAGRWLARHTGAAEPALLSDSLSTQIAAAAAGIGVALVPEVSAARFQLTPIAVAETLRAKTGALPTDTLYIVTHRAMRDVPRVHVVWEALVDHFAQLADDNAPSAE